LRAEHVVPDIVTEPVAPYGLTKLTVEHLARIYGQQLGLHVVCLRYFTVYGPRQRPDMAFTRFLTAAYAGQTIEILGDGKQSRDFSFVGDVVDATIRALDAPPGSIYNIGGGEPTSVNDILSVVGHLLGCQLEVARRPQALGDVRHTWADTRRARQELGWSPRTDLRTGVAAQLAWVDERHMNDPAGANPDGRRDIAIAAS
jgi:nucleoside-diphosphate-sugar epimerase